MIGYPVILRGDQVRALVVGGGAVGARKISTLLECGASVRVVAPELRAEVAQQALEGRLQWIMDVYGRAHLGDANLVFAATSSDDVNAAVLRDARGAGRLVNVASDAMSGDFFTPATWRAESLLVSVFSYGVPMAAARIRDHISRILDAGIPGALSQLAALRKGQLESGAADRWQEASRDLIGDDFLHSVTSGDFQRRLERWR
jgi:siroheme synthase-like protein